MKKSTRFSALLACAFAVYASASASATTGKCVLQVEGRTYLNGPCEIRINDSLGSFSIGAGETRRSKHFAYVNMEDGKAQGYWNKDPGDDRAQDALGALAHDGACWTNEKARVCAYK